MVGKFYLVLPRGHVHGHQAVVHLLNRGGLTVDRGTEPVVIGHAEKHQLVRVIGGLCGKAGVRRSKCCHTGGTAGGTVGSVGILAAVVQLLVGQGFQQAAKGGDLVVVQQNRAAQNLGAFFLAYPFQLVRCHVAVVGKAHRHPVFVLVEGVGVGLAGALPAGQILAGPLGLLVFGDQRVPHAQQAAQGVVLGVGLGVHVPLDADLGVKRHDARRNRRVEELQAAPVEPQPQIVVRTVGINAVKRIVRQRGGDVLDGIIGFGNQIAVHVPLGVLRQRQMQTAVQQAESQHGGGQNRAPPPLTAAKMPQQRKNHDTQHRHAEDSPEPRGLVQHAKDRVAVVVLARHNGKHHRRQRQEDRQPQRPRQTLLGQRRAGEQIARCTAQNQNRHIVPPRVVARVERIERAVQHRHKRTGNADL